MALHPLKSRRKRIEAAVSVSLLWLCSMGFLVGMQLRGGDVPWTTVVGDWWEVLAVSTFGAVALIGYVVREPR